MKCPHCHKVVKLMLAEPAKARCGWSGCAKDFVPDRGGQQFCSPKCRKARRVEDGLIHADGTLVEKQCP